MSITTLIYLMGLLSSINYALFVFAIIFLVMTIVCGILYLSAQDFGEIEEQENLSRKIKKWSIHFVFIVVLMATIPSKKTMWLMLGSSALEKSDIPEKVLIIINKKLDDIIKEKVNE